MRASPKRVCVAIALATFALSLHATAQDEPPPEDRPRRKGWFNWGGGGEAPEKPRAKQPQASRLQMRSQQQQVPMVVSAGKLYIVVGSTLKKLDAETLAEEATAEIPTGNPERERAAKESFLRRFDADQDGRVTADEVPRPEILEKLDRNFDGVITEDEIPVPRSLARAVGPVSLLVEGGSVYVFAAEKLLRYKTDGLTLMAEVTIRPNAPLTGANRPGPFKRRPDADRPAKRRKELRPPAGPPEEPLKF